MSWFGTFIAAKYVAKPMIRKGYNPSERTWGEHAKKPTTKLLQSGFFFKFKIFGKKSGFALPIDFCWVASLTRYSWVEYRSLLTILLFLKKLSVYKILPVPPNKKRRLLKIEFLLNPRLEHSRRSYPFLSPLDIDVETPLLIAGGNSVQEPARNTERQWKALFLCYVCSFHTWRKHLIF